MEIVMLPPELNHFLFYYRGFSTWLTFRDGFSLYLLNVRVNDKSNQIWASLGVHLTIIGSISN